MKTLNLGFDLGMEDTSFLNRMAAGGVSDDLTPRSGDISFDDHTNYLAVNIDIKNISDEVAEILNYIDSI